MRSDRLMFDRPQRASDRAFAKLGKKLLEHGVAFYVDFRQPRPIEWISGADIRTPGTVVLKDGRGLTRSFTGHRRSHVETPITWSSLGECYTLELWVRIEKSVLPQSIWFSNYFTRETGFRLDGDRMMFYVPDGMGEVMYSLIHSLVMGSLFTWRQ